MAEATTTTSSRDSTRIFRRLVSPTVNLRLSIVCDPLGEVTTIEYGPPGLRPLALNLPFESVVLETLELVGLYVIVTDALATVLPLAETTVPLISDVSS